MGGYGVIGYIAMLDFFSVLNYEDEPMDINVQTLRKMYAGEFLNLGQFSMQKVKVKTEWWSFRHLTPHYLIDDERDKSTSAYADNGI